MPISENARGPSLAWTKVPLIAFVLFTVGPGLIAAVLYFIYTILGIKGSREVGGYGSTAYGYYLDAGILLAPLLFAIITWPFLALFFICKLRAKRESADIRSLRFAMWGSLVAMSLPNLLFLFISSEEMIADFPGSGEGLGLAIGIFGFVVPVLGVIGWFVGRIIAPVVSWFVTDFLLYLRVHSRPRR